MLLKLKKTSSIPVICPYHQQLEQQQSHLQQHNDNQKHQQQQHQKLHQQQQTLTSTTTHHREHCTATTSSQPQPFESIPGPKPSLPFIGTNWTYFPIVGPFAGLDLNEINQLKYRKYGPIIREELAPGYPMLTIFEPSDIKQVFKSEATCPARPALEYIVKHRQSDPERYPNIGLANMMGSEWRELRSKLAPVMLSKGLKGRFIESQNRVSHRLVEFVRNKSSSSLIKNCNEIAENDSGIYNERTCNQQNGNFIQRYDSVLDDDYHDEPEYVRNFLMINPTSATTNSQDNIRINNNFYRNDDIYYATTATTTNSHLSSESILTESRSATVIPTAATSTAATSTTTTSTPMNTSHVIDNVQDIFSRYAMESIMNLCISHEITCLDDTRATLAAEDGEKLLKAAMLFFEAQHKLYYGNRFLNIFKTENQYEQLCSSHNDIHDIASKYIDRVIARLENDTISDFERETILDTLYRSKAFTNMLDIKASIVDFIIGGIYPIANALTMTLYLLATNPAAQERVYDEIKTHLNVNRCVLEEQNNNNANNDNRSRSCFTTNNHFRSSSGCNSFGSDCDNNANNNNDYDHSHFSSTNTQLHCKNDIKLDIESLERLKYLKLCLKEAHRMMPTIPGIARIIQRDLTLSNYHVPKNTLVFCNSMTTCRMGKYFERPDEFVPERWDRNSPLRDSSKNPDLNFAMLQFGYGARKCIGHTFADLQMNIALAKLINSYQIEPVDSESSSTNLEREFNFIVVPKKPVKLRFIPRND